MQVGIQSRSSASQQNVRIFEINWRKRRNFQNDFLQCQSGRQLHYRYNAGKFSEEKFRKMQIVWLVAHLDQRDGMNEQLRLYNVGLLSRFVGMLTDSRSFFHISKARIFPQDSLQSSGGNGCKTALFPMILN